ncbi:hypothetical protein RchiOBHm_Chr5g0029401 [Rosa chinensis]|uniref:Uncharacterized protein n=1 Tax=Rosa chinensis TaxID=74649 RepID=A0A2P6Q9M0_ROSCH|nr:hypothetical protein RchiOBHm_Chr5g0029401 [Rosa chinensis]
MVADLDFIYGETFSFRVKRTGKMKERRNWKGWKKRTNRSPRNLFLCRNGWYGKHCSTRECEKSQSFLASFATSNLSGDILV